MREALSKATDYDGECRQRRNSAIDNLAVPIGIIIILFDLIRWVVLVDDWLMILSSFRFTSILTNPKRNSNYGHEVVVYSRY